MIRQLCQCPYCQQCQVALNDDPKIVFNPDGPDPSPCLHLVWLDGRYAQWELNHLGINVWDVDGWALFAHHPEPFLALLPQCQERQLAALRVKPDEQPQ